METNKINKRIFGLLFIIVILTIIVLSLKKTETNIYIGDYSYVGVYGGIDIQIKIDDKLILEDSLYNNPFNFIIIKEKLRYGSHTVDIISEKANIKLNKNIFLLPYQYIHIEFLPGNNLIDLNIPIDTLFFDDGTYISQTIDSFMNYNINSITDIQKSSFRIECLFNPYYLE